MAAQRSPFRASFASFDVCVVTLLLVAAVAVPQPARAEPIRLDASAVEPHVSGVAALPDAAARVDALPGDATDELAIPAAVPHPAASPGGDSVDALAGKRAAAALAPLPWAAEGPMMEAPAGVVRRSVSPLSATADDTGGEEPDWEREIKEAVRPIYDELAASGVIDAVQGFRSYLAMLGVYLSSEYVAPPGQRTRAEGVAEPHGGTNETTWAARSGTIDALTLARSEAQIEKEKLIASVLVQEWLAAAAPWIYGFAALFIVWQIVRLTFAFARSRSARKLRRAGRSSRHSAASARARARS